MPEVVTIAAEPLKLAAEWRLPPSARGATVHELRVVSGAARQPDTAQRDELRALVAEAVRQELRSDLGRQMTRSIRRLVRQELAGLLARLGRP